MVNQPQQPANDEWHENGILTPKGWLDSNGNLVPWQHIAPTADPNKYGTYVTKDSGERQDFETGARRDTQEGKLRWDLLPYGPLERLAELYRRGAEKYGEHNYQKGIPYKRVWASLLRHAFAWYKEQLTGITDGEDHAAAVAWNAFALMFYEDEIAAERLPATLNDIRRSK